MLRPHLRHLLALAFCATVACTQSGSGQPLPSGNDGNAAVVTPIQTPPAQSGNTVTPSPVVPIPVAPANPNLASDPQVVPVVQGANVRLMGRIETSDPAGPIIAWPASQIVVGFAGTRLTANLTELDQETYNGVSVSNYFSVVVDNAPATRIKLSRTAPSYLVASGLTQGQHQVVLTKLTEAQLGRVQFQGATTDGALSFTSAAPNRKIEFVGDSGTAGYGAAGTPPCTFTAATEDASVAYPTVVGTLLNADVHNLSFSGKGLVQNRDMVRDAEKTLPVLWARTLPNDEDVTPYAPNGWLPQAVIMTIGGNDFYAQVLDQTTFNSKVTAFIKQVQALYSGVHVYLGVSPMLRNDSHAGQREAGIAYAQAAVTDLADDHVHYIDLPPDLGANGYGCDDHMNPTTHRVVAASIAQVLKTQFGW